MNHISLKKNKQALYQRNIFRNFLAMGAMLTVATSSMAKDKLESGKYSLDPMHSKVGFEVSHLVVSSVEGKFKDFSGTIQIEDKFQNSKVDVEVKVASIDTGVEKRDGHLKSADFFDAEKYPKLTFKSQKIKGQPKSFELIGDLTIKGKTKSVIFDSKYTGSVVDGWKNNKAAFTAKTKISRKEFGLTWNDVVEAGPVVGDEVEIELKLQAIREKKESK